MPIRSFVSRVSASALDRGVLHSWPLSKTADKTEAALPRSGPWKLHLLSAFAAACDWIRNQASQSSNRRGEGVRSARSAQEAERAGPGDTGTAGDFSSLSHNICKGPLPISGLVARFSSAQANVTAAGSLAAGRDPWARRAQNELSVDLPGGNSSRGHIWRLGLPQGRLE